MYRNIYHPIPNYQYKWNLANDYKKKKLKLEEYDPFGFVDFIEGSKIKYKDVYEIGAAGGANLIPFKILNKKVGGNELSKKLIKFSKNLFGDDLFEISLLLMDIFLFFISKIRSG